MMVTRMAAACVMFAAGAGAAAADDWRVEYTSTPTIQSRDGQLHAIEASLAIRRSGSKVVASSPVSGLGGDVCDKDGWQCVRMPYVLNFAVDTHWKALPQAWEDVIPIPSLRLDAPGRREGHITYEYRSEQRSGGLVILSARDHAEQAVIAHAEVMTRGEARFGQWTDVRFDPAVGVEGVVEVIRRLSDGDVPMNISKPAARDVVRDEAWHALNGLDVPPSGIKPFDAGSAANACLSGFRQRWMPAWVVAADDAYEVGCVLEPGKWASPLVLRVEATGGEWVVTDALSRIYDVIDWKR